jgi:hypothetical protein
LPRRSGDGLDKTTPAKSGVDRASEHYGIEFPAVAVHAQP